ncbi:hypothetical protein Purlil1_11252 [Purpureocillium lilacinum]|uniref:Uncharacterized protein n=1 Tax=Purpureocillium lilacinum TaxID=33203 RepID=A0ABR0BK87_PURLI|nr:hypothetical protein Purlil1_11252 [Purpureocillium lilacinum]
MPIALAQPRWFPPPASRRERLHRNGNSPGARDVKPEYEVARAATTRDLATPRGWHGGPCIRDTAGAASSNEAPAPPGLVAQGEGAARPSHPPAGRRSVCAEWHDCRWEASVDDSTMRPLRIAASRAHPLMPPPAGSSAHRTYPRVATSLLFFLGGGPRVVCFQSSQRAFLYAQVPDLAWAGCSVMLQAAPSPDRLRAGLQLAIGLRGLASRWAD